MLTEKYLTLINETMGQLKAVTPKPEKPWDMHWVIEVANPCIRPDRLSFMGHMLGFRLEVGVSEYNEKKVGTGCGGTLLWPIEAITKWQVEVYHPLQAVGSCFTLIHESPACAVKNALRKIKEMSAFDGEHRYGLKPMELAECEGTL